MKISLSDTLDEAFRGLGNELTGFKSSLLGLCVDIDRYLSITCQIDTSGDVGLEEFSKALEIFPRFKSLTLEQFNRYLILFRKIRDESAHYHLAMPIPFDEDLEEFVWENAMDPIWKTSFHGNITVYGAVLVLALLSQKYMIWPFCTTFYGNRYFIEITKHGRGDFRIQEQKFLEFLCGKGKPIVQAMGRTLEKDEIYINDTLKRTLTSVFFGLEIITMSEDDRLRSSIPSFRRLLEGSKLFDGDLTERIVWLRNQWFHGTFIGDEVVYDNKTIRFTLELVLGILNDLLKAIRQEDRKPEWLIEDLNAASQAFFDFYALRIVEVSHKILDSRLLREEKLEDRLKSARAAYERMKNASQDLYEAFASLRYDGFLLWNVKPAKFQDDIKPRKTMTANLKIFKIHCDSGFRIGDFKTNRQDIVLASVSVETGFENKVNGIELPSLKGKEVGHLSKFITIFEAELPPNSELSPRELPSQDL